MNHGIRLALVLVLSLVTAVPLGFAQNDEEEVPTVEIEVTQEQYDEFITRTTGMLEDLNENLQQGINYGTDADGSAVIRWCTEEDPCTDDE